MVVMIGRGAVAVAGNRNECKDVQMSMCHWRLSKLLLSMPSDDPSHYHPPSATTLGDRLKNLPRKGAIPSLAVAPLLNTMVDAPMADKLELMELVERLCESKQVGKEMYMRLKSA